MGLSRPLPLIIGIKMHLTLCSHKLLKAGDLRNPCRGERHCLETLGQKHRSKEWKESDTWMILSGHLTNQN